VEQAAEEAGALGATIRHREEGLVISSSPGGFTFCLDVPASVFERERSFWAALTGWEGQGGARSALPVRLELRRAEPGDRVAPPPDRDGRPRRPLVPPDRRVTDS